MLRGWFSEFLGHSKQRHNKSWGTKPALRGVAVDHGPLHRMQGTVLLQILYCEHLAAIEGRDELKARVHRPVPHGAVFGAADDDGAGAAITLITPFLGSMPSAAPQPFQHGQSWFDACYFLEFIAEKEAD